MGNNDEDEFIPNYENLPHVGSLFSMEDIMEDGQEERRKKKILKMLIKISRTLDRIYKKLEGEE